MPAGRASMNDQLLLNRYRLVERLASGGSAEVWRAEDEQLGRPVAVKRLHPHLVPDEASRKRLAAEARAAAGLSHPVVVGIYDIDATGDAPAIVMELVEGESLSARTARDGPLPPREAVAITADLAEALFHAHQRGVIHRDVKPGNVLLGADGSTRLVDFGIAHSLAESAERLTQTGTVIGTLSAMAPEQLAGGEITPRTDLYGVGVVLHEALIGRPPYPASSPLALAEAQRAGPPDMSDVEPALAAVVAACLAYDPGDRPLHAGALAAALRQWLAGDPSAALAMAPVAPVDTDEITRPIPAVIPLAEPAAAARDAAAAPVSTPPPRSRPWLIALLAGLIGLVLVGAIVVANGDLDADPAGDPATPTLVPTPSPTPSPTPMPEWLREQVSKVAEDCGPDVAAQYEAEATGLDEKQAEELAKQLREACRDEEGGGGGGNGNGGNSGRGGGGGGDD